MDAGLCHCIRGSDQDHIQEKETQKGKMVLEEPLQIAEKEEKLNIKEKRKDKPIWMQSSKEYQGEIRKPSSVINVKK